MNTLERVILDQHARIVAAGKEPVEILEEAQAEILAVATPEMMRELLDKKVIPESETRGTYAQCRAFQSSNSITNRSISAVRAGHYLADINMLVERQGYTGGLIFDGDDTLVYGSSMLFRGLKEDDPIQVAMGDTFYPPMAWAKALRAEAYRQRPDSAKELTIAEYLAKLGLSLGCAVTKQGDVVGATGFMPGERLEGLVNHPVLGEHIVSEEVEAYRLSGLCDQAVVDPDILLETPNFAMRVVSAGGSLN